MTMSLPYRVVVAFLALHVSVASAQSAPADQEAALRAVDARQTEAIVRGDVEAMSALLHPSFRANAPSNRVLERGQVLSMIKSGEIGAKSFERTPESVTITGNVGVVMGREVITPTPVSEAGKTFGAEPLSRRYTNVYLREGGTWRLLARHINVIMKPESVAKAR